MLKTKLTDIPIYKGKLLTIITNNKQELLVKFPDIEIKENIYAHARVIYYKGSHTLTTIFNFNANSKITYGIIAHEALHIANMIAEHRGIIPDFQNDEPITYLTEWITNEIHKFIEKEGFQVCVRAYT
jgi:hypothetical protein